MSGDGKQSTKMGGATCAFLKSYENGRNIFQSISS